jgi:hypothetical protein
MMHDWLCKYKRPMRKTGALLIRTLLDNLLRRGSECRWLIDWLLVDHVVGHCRYRELFAQERETSTIINDKHLMMVPVHEHVDIFNIVEQTEHERAIPRLFALPESKRLAPGSPSVVSEVEFKRNFDVFTESQVRAITVVDRRKKRWNFHVAYVLLTYMYWWYWWLHCSCGSSIGIMCFVLAAQYWLACNRFPSHSPKVISVPAISHLVSNDWCWAGCLYLLGSGL